MSFSEHALRATPATYLLPYIFSDNTARSISREQRSDGTRCS